MTKTSPFQISLVAALLLACGAMPDRAFAADAPSKAAPAKPAPKSRANLMTRDELRACMNEQDRLAQISTQVQKEQVALDGQLAEVKKMDADLARKRDALDPADAAGKQALTEEEAKRDGVAETYNTRLRALREQGKAFDEGRAAWVQRCTTRDYDELDEAAIMRERKKAAGATK